VVDVHELAVLVERVEARLDDLVSVGLEAIHREVPAYAGIGDHDFAADVRESLTRHGATIMRCLRDGADPTPEDLAFVRANAAARAERDIPLADYLHTFRVFHRVLMDAILRESGRSPGAAAGLEAARGLLEYADLATTYAGDAYLAAQQSLLADSDRVRRDLLEDLLAGREPETGSRLAMAHAAGLTPGSPCVLIAAVAVDPVEDPQALRLAAASTARALRGALPPLVVIRQREIVIVRACDTRPAAGLTEPLQRSQRNLAAAGLRLAIGVSTTLQGVERAADGYREAYVAVHSVLRHGGVVALDDLSPLEYLALRSDATAQRLVSPAIADFLTEDAARGATLTRTLLAYVEADLNVTSAAKRLFVHPNTAHYRLARIADRTGLDMRNVADLMQLLVAIRLHAPDAAPPYSSPASRR
jgi:hypothetical protein